MQTYATPLSLPEFLDAQADAEAANGLHQNADVYRQRAFEASRQLRSIQKLCDENSTLCDENAALRAVIASSVRGLQAA